MDIAIIHTYLLTFEGKGLGIIRDGGIGIEDGKITFVGKTKNLNFMNADQIIDGSNHVTMPGLINAHTHTGLTLLRGGAQDVPEQEWMNKGIGPFTKYLQPIDLIAGAKLGVAEGIRSGTTTFAENTNFVSSIIKNVYLPFKVRVVGIETINEVISDRVILKPTDLYELDTSKGDEALKRANSLFEEFQDHDLVSTMYGPQALDMVTLETLKTITEQAKRQNCKCHMHVAQGKREQIQIKKRYGSDTSTVKVLKNNNLLSEILVAVHIHDTTIQERELMVTNDVCMIGCPSSISCIDGIVPPLNHYVQLGGTAGIGTDQAPGPGHHNLFQELKIASIGSKIITRDPTALPPWESLKLVTSEGAKVLGLAEKIGTITEGKQADIITINLKTLNLAPFIEKPFYNIIPNLVYSTTGTEVDNVIINGEFIIRDNRFLTIDFDSIFMEANERAQEIFDRASEEWQKAGSHMVNYHHEGYL